jgi:hypothetical protein
MHLEKFVQSSTGKYIASILLGLGLASLFRAVCKGSDCVIQKAPPLQEIDGQIYKIDNKCYKFEQTHVHCNSNKKIYEFA